MKILLIILTFLISQKTVAQSDVQETLYLKGASYLHGVNLQDTSVLTFEINYDSSLYYLLKLNAQYPNYRTNQTLDDLSVAYFEKKEFTNSIIYALKVLTNFKTNNIENDAYCFECNSACNRIGYIYQLQKQYEKALAYYDSSKTKYTTLPEICSIGYYLSQVPSDYNLFICYKYLSLKQKALEILTPYFFDSEMNGYLDSIIIDDYQNFALTLYTKEEFQKHITAAIDSLYYYSDVKQNKETLSYDFKVNSWIDIFNCKIYLANGISWRNETNEFYFFYTKQNLIKRVINSIGYKLAFNP